MLLYYGQFPQRAHVEMALQWMQLRSQKYGAFWQPTRCFLRWRRCLLATHCRSCLQYCLLTSLVFRMRTSAVTAVKRSPQVVSWNLLSMSFVCHTLMNTVRPFLKVIMATLPHNPLPLPARAESTNHPVFPAAHPDHKSSAHHRQTDLHSVYHHYTHSALPDQTDQHPACHRCS
jgi:hypothetical protein